MSSRSSEIVIFFGGEQPIHRFNSPELDVTNSRIFISDVVLRPSVLGQDRSETINIGLCLGLGLAGLSLVLYCETRSCHTRRHDLEGYSNVSSAIYSISILWLEHHYCGDQQWRSLS